mgnify:CR=1 FL=1
MQLSPPPGMGLRRAGEILSYLYKKNALLVRFDICENDDLPQCLKTCLYRGVRVGSPAIGKCRKVFEKWYKNRSGIKFRAIVVFSRL